MANEHSRSEHNHDHGKPDKRRVLIAAVLTSGFMVVEAVGGILAGALALLADAGHMLTDSVSLLLAWYAFHLAEHPATNSMSYGFGRVKTLVAYTNGLAIFVVGAWIVYEAIERFEHPSAVLGGPMLGVGVAGLAVNVIAYLVLHGGDRENLNMRGAILHVLGDLLGSVAAIVAAVVILLTGWYPIDPILSALVAVMLFASAWRLTRDGGRLLLEGAPGTADPETIARDLESAIPGVEDVHHIHVWSLDGKSNLATMHVEIAPQADAAAIVARVKQRLASMHGIAHATIEIDTEPGVAGKADHHHDGVVPERRPRAKTQISKGQKIAGHKDT
ncbi:cation diffusion facilitator family transporter [Brucella sp. IR073]|uniref:cation diffusion facilitator family transporter n=1 Tax=unclassified Brucella TaxID=2632610 RepID=UPI003B982EF2